ncbi:hypothetical protein JCM10207_002972 [Rhodosporidiobolus poonsookiae]
MGRAGRANWWLEGSDAYCGDCSRYFPSRSSILQHLQSSNRHIYCTPCDRDFDSTAARRSHWANSSDHSFCTLCDTDWDDDDELAEHQRDEHYACEACNTIFATETGRYEHGSQTHPFCETHRRAFRSNANLNAHLSSSAHRTADFPCPAGCGRCFIDRSAAVLHLENGACPTGITRARIDYGVRQLDQNHFITNPSQRLILPPPDSTGSGSSRSMTTSRFIATEASWDAYEQMYRCVLCQRLFSTLHALNQHLVSPRHAAPDGSTDKLYRCPNLACRREFPTLSALVQHGEHGTCGLMQIRGVQTTLDGVLGGMRRLTL